eukprot:CAMPEP_0118866786 /NCGR_PEP_ID=MMETSP1163-20130328/10580_1 /TAXON_ID=124430 /ORGANISM="Phaeomonas parva, Strain CCMP2877" /LENGTH=518 /DNA_ID=CAMNT_0006801129 /DNA_START=277 /DNA_END=1833 /DNA_ORIENTATION=+
MKAPLLCLGVVFAVYFGGLLWAFLDFGTSDDGPAEGGGLQGSDGVVTDRLSARRRDRLHGHTATFRGGQQAEGGDEAYITFLCDDGFISGALALGKSLIDVGSTRKMYVMATKGKLSKKAATLLETIYAGVIEVPKIRNPSQDADFRERTYPDMVRKHPEWRGMHSGYQDCLYTKVRLFQQFQFSKLVYLDADILVRYNIDELFDHPQLTAAPDPLTVDKFNSGLMVIEPNPATWDEMWAAIPHTRSYNGGDQGFLNAFFADWYASPAVHRLPATYNIQTKVSEGSKFSWMAAYPHRVVHYSPKKPWRDPLCIARGEWVAQFHCIWWHTLLSFRDEQSRAMKAALDRDFDVDLGNLLAVRVTSCADAAVGARTLRMYASRIMDDNKSYHSRLETAEDPAVTPIDPTYAILTLGSKKDHGSSPYVEALRLRAEYELPDGTRVEGDHDIGTALKLSRRSPFMDAGSDDGVANLCVQPAVKEGVAGFYIKPEGGAEGMAFECFDGCAKKKPKGEGWGQGQG